MRSSRLPLLIASLLLVVAACGGGDGEATTTVASAASDDTTETTAAAETTTTAAPAETTTTAAPETTTTAAAETTTTAAAVITSEEAQAIAMAKADAALAQVPEGWTSEITTGFEVETGSDDVFSVCTDDDQFDVAELDSFTRGSATLEADGPPAAGSFFPSGNASIEARIFESASVAEDAFTVLETVFGTEEGRQCLADQFLAEMTADLPVGEEVEFTLEEGDTSGSDVSVTITFGMDVEGIVFSFVIEIAAARDAECTVYGVFLGFNEPIDPDVRDALFEAAIAAA